MYIAFSLLSYLKDKIKDNKGNTIDPLSQAFELNKKLQKRARDEPELRKEYMELSNKCKTFTTELSNACRDKEDLMALLDIDQKHFAPIDDENDDENDDEIDDENAKKESCSEVVTSLKKAINSNDKEASKKLSILHLHIRTNTGTIDIVLGKKTHKYKVSLHFLSSSKFHPRPQSILQQRRFFIDIFQFVAHPHIQMLVNFVVYSGLPKNIQRTRIVYLLLPFILYTIFFPVLVLLYLVFPDSKISKIMSTPYMKFVSHISQFIIFLFLIAGSSLRDNHTPTVIGKL